MPTPVGLDGRPSYSWMAFVDGENFTLRGEEVASSQGISLTLDSYFERGRFLWMPVKVGTDLIAAGGIELLPKAIRSSYYTSVQGDQDDIDRVTDRLLKLRFSPNVFLKSRTRDPKGVDIALTRDMLVHAFQDNFEVAVLMAGDGGYVPLVEEVKRLGKPVLLWFFSNGLSPDLRRTCDEFHDLTSTFVTFWRREPGEG